MAKSEDNTELYKNFLEVNKALESAETPIDRRTMYYYKISWWRHPIKRYRQKQKIKKLLSTDWDKK